VSLRESGDPLDGLVRELERFERTGPARVLGALRTTGDALIRETFDRSREPSGQAWKPLKRGPSRSRPGRRPLVKTGALRSWASHGVIVGTTSVWKTSRIGEFHQLGTSRIPARPFLPPGRLPLTWGLRLSHAAESTLPQWR
jgi:hypothetical protein